MNLRKGFCVSLLALVLALCVCAMPAKAETATVASGTCGDALTWTLDDGGTLTISGTGAMTDYAAASDAPWYSQRASVTRAVLEDTVTAVGARAFYNCTGLKSVTLGRAVTTIGTYAFRGCTALEEVTVPATVTQIDGSAFRACSSLKTVLFEGNAPTLGSFALSECAAGITVQHYENATGFDAEPWTGYTVLPVHKGQWIVDTEATCTTDGSHHTTCEICGGEFTETIPSLGHNYESGTCTRCGEIKIVASGTCGDNAQWSLDGLGTLHITGSGFMKSWTSSSSVPWYAYREQIQTVEIADTITSIGAYAFQGCSSMTSVTIPESVTSIGYEAFYGCTSLTGVYITDIAAWCNINFWGSYSNPLYYADNLYLNGELITNLVIPDGVTAIPTYAFEGCTGLTSVTIPESVIAISSSAFRGCTSLTSVTIPESVTSIGYEAFYGCTGLTCVTIPESVTAISSYAFYGCSSLTSVTIPESVTSIGDYAFYDCTGLTSVTIPESVTSIGDYAFYDCTGLTSVTIPDSVTSIGESAFYGCTGLTSVTIPESVTSIGNSAFYNCKSLTSVTIPDSVTSIGNAAFSGCTGLTSVTIPDSVTSIGYSAFWDCTGLTSVTIPNSVTSIDGYAFYNCKSLTSVIYCGTQEQWNAIQLGDDNGRLTSATLQFHSYENGVCVFCQAVCQHNWQEATCEAPKTCTICKMVAGNAPGHNMQQTSDGIAPTCEAAGKTAALTCSNCGKVEGGVEIPAIGHDMKEIAPAVDPTCTGAGNAAIFGCANGCGKIEGGEEIPATGHTYENDICTVCGQGKYIVGDANGDGKVNLKDAILALQAANGKDAAVESSAADVNADGKVNLKDAILILKRANGNKDPFPSEK